MTLPTDVGHGAVDPAAAGDRCPSCRAPVAGSWLVCASCGARLAVAAELPVGTRLLDGRFAIGRVLGRGGFGITYETDDTRLHRKVAVKELFPDAAVRHGSTVLTPPDARLAFREARERFLREARVLARFSHPGIVRVYEVFETHGTAYLVLEMLEGQTLSEVLRDRGRPFTETAALDVATRVGGALGVIHRAGLLHRDVSPSNLVVTSSGRIVLIDFGLARSYDADHTAAMTRIVTPGYAPPEQYLGSGRFGPATDVYGLAATLYRLLTVQTPAAAMDRQHGGELMPPRQLNPAVSKLVSDAVLDGLELNPDHRPQSADAFLCRLGLDASPAPSVSVSSPLPVDLRSPPADDAPSTVRPAGTTRVPLARSPSPPAVASAPPFGPPPTWPSAPAASTARPVAVPDAARYLPDPIVGPPRPGRWVVSLPVAGAAVALVSTAPVLFAFVLVLVGLPVAATAGDLLLRRQRQAQGGGSGWLDRRPPAAAAGPRLVRNAVVSLARALPTLCLLAVLVACWYPIQSSRLSPSVADGFLRLSGLAVGLLLVVPALGGSHRFATGVAVDALHERLVPPGQRPTQAALILWLACIGIAAFAFLFTPEVFPLQT